MKQQDVAILIIIVFITGVFSFIVGNKFVTPSDKKEKVEVVTPISKDFNAGNVNNINENSINPTVKIEIAPNNNTQPFINGEQ